MRCLKKIIAALCAVTISTSVTFSATAIKISENVKKCDLHEKNKNTTRMAEEIIKNKNMDDAAKNERIRDILESDLSEVVNMTNKLINSTNGYIESRLNVLQQSPEAKNSPVFGGLIKSTSSSLSKLKSTLDNFCVKNIHATMIIYKYIDELQLLAKTEQEDSSKLEIIKSWKDKIDNIIKNVPEILDENLNVNMNIQRNVNKISPRHVYGYIPVRIDSSFIQNNAQTQMPANMRFVCNNSQVYLQISFNFSKNNVILNNNNYSKNNINLNNQINNDVNSKDSSNKDDDLDIKNKLNEEDKKEELEDLCDLIEETIEKGIKPSDENYSDIDDQCLIY